MLMHTNHVKVFIYFNMGVIQAACLPTYRTPNQNTIIIYNNNNNNKNKK